MAMPLDTIRAALVKTNGNVAAAARALRLTRTAVAYRISKSQKLQQVITDYRQSLVDNAESGLSEAIKNGEPYAICFTLKTLGRDRGYIERVEHTGQDGGPVEFTFLIQRADDSQAIDVTPQKALTGGNGHGNGNGDA